MFRCSSNQPLNALSLAVLEDAPYSSSHDCLDSKCSGRFGRCRSLSSPCRMFVLYIIVTLRSNVPCRVVNVMCDHPTVWCCTEGDVVSRSSVRTTDTGCGRSSIPRDVCILTGDPANNAKKNSQSYYSASTGFQLMAPAVPWSSASSSAMSLSERVKLKTSEFDLMRAGEDDMGRGINLQKNLSTQAGVSEDGVGHTHAAATT